ncbi:MAG: radical SAM protein [candidate division WOR-3 bacterium]|nr:MAG: radical SAM protein [candidate division WOR-3 bacterium]
MKTFGFQWHVTSNCNIRCRHCYQNDFTDKEDLDTRTIGRIVDTLGSTLQDRLISVNLTGGEPFLRNDFFDILEMLSGRKNVQELYIITNGTVIDQKVIDRLKVCEKLEGIKISLEGSTPEINARIRNNETFQDVLVTVERLMAHSLPVLLMFTLGSYNYQDVLGMLELAKRLQVSGAILERFIPLGRGAGMADQYLKNTEWLKIITNCINFLDLGISPYDFLTYRALWVDFKDEISVRGAQCNLGDESMALMPNGDVYPCRRLPVVIGNVVRDDFQAILDRLRAYRAAFDRTLNGLCADCVVTGCIGCRALVYAMTGDIRSGDPQCYRDLL